MCTNQHGFRKKHCCETQLHVLEIINDLTGALDAGCEVDVLFHDFSKFFDRVFHNCDRLCEKGFYSFSEFSTLVNHISAGFQGITFILHQTIVVLVF